MPDIVVMFRPTKPRGCRVVLRMKSRTPPMIT
jgi:hypothetical protein